MRLFKYNVRLFLLTFFIFCYFLLLLLLLVTLVNYLFTIEGSLFVTFVTFFTACNFHELLFIVERGRGIVLLYLFIVQGERVCLDFFF